MSEEKEYEFQIKVVGTFGTMAENEEQAVEWIMENIGDWAGDLEYIVENGKNKEKNVSYQFSKGNWKKNET
tara:strand:- start:144 stop:356 length:213 start_codon:yes stop_codon:yes gene_type:complete